MTKTLAEVLVTHDSNPWTAWRCPCCGQRSSWLATDRERTLVALEKTWRHHNCPGTVRETVSVDLDADPFARC